MSLVVIHHFSVRAVSILLGNYPWFLAMVFKGTTSHYSSSPYEKAGGESFI